MAIVDLIMPKMGESIIEATILKWVKQVGETVDMDETILEIATDKVDSEIPSPVQGVVKEILFKEGDVVEIGKVIARIENDAPQASEPKVEQPKVEQPKVEPLKEAQVEVVQTAAVEEVPFVSQPQTVVTNQVTEVASKVSNYSNDTSKRFYSPLVKSIASKENIGLEELEQIPGSGAKGRVTKKDILAYVGNRTAGASVQNSSSKAVANASQVSMDQEKPAIQSLGGADEIIQMDRMRKLIADHMVMSKRTSPHVTSFVEADVTEIVNWRNAVKGPFLKKYGEKITFTPIFMEAVVRAIRDFPLINVAVDEDKIIVKKNLNLGMATALPSGNLIVPVIKNADHLNLLGLTKSVNDLANRARTNALKPDEISGGTFTLTNVGTFGNVMGTPIINQPQVAILAVGAIRKKPVVIETESGDTIGIRHMMFMSLSYDHRVVDGFLGGSFLRRIGDYLESFKRDYNI